MTQIIQITTKQDDDDENKSKNGEEIRKWTKLSDKINNLIQKLKSTEMDSDSDEYKKIKMAPIKCNILKDKCNEYNIDSFEHKGDNSDTNNNSEQPEACITIVNKLNELGEKIKATNIRDVDRKIFSEYKNLYNIAKNAGCKLPPIILPKSVDTSDSGDGGDGGDSGDGGDDGVTGNNGTTGDGGDSGDSGDKDVTGDNKPNECTSYAKRLKGLVLLANSSVNDRKIIIK